MIHKHYGNLFEHVIPEAESSPEVMNIIIHGCNAQGAMGSGFAKEVRSRYPELYKEYHDTYLKRGLAMGEVVWYPVTSNLVIANAITQNKFGYDGKKYVSYDALDDAFKAISIMTESVRIEYPVVNLHFPLIGAGLAGGEWSIISTIIEETNPISQKNLYILR